MSGRFVPVAVAASLAAVMWWAVAASAEPAVEYPIVFDTRADLEPLGLSVGLTYGAGETAPKPTFPNACYAYNDEGGYWFSVSDVFLAHYKAKGFTRESLCLALVSFPYFDPETGERMPTFAVLEDTTTRDQAIAALDADTFVERYAYLIPEGAPKSKEALYEQMITVVGVFKSKEELERAIAAAKRGDFKSLTYEQVIDLGIQSNQAPTNELPLAVPDCFKNGTPFLDCNWRYSMTTGRKLSSATTRLQREFGQAIDRLMQDTLKAKSFASAQTHPDGYLLNDGDIASVPGSDEKQEPIFMSRIPTALFDAAQEPLTFIDVSPAFPRGYGYALHSTGEKDEEISVGALPGEVRKRKKSSRYSNGHLQRIVYSK